MVKIFISYRRADSNKESRLIYEALAKRFGEHNIFRDKDRIPKGVDFRKTIEQYIFNSDEILVVIGEKWLDIRENDEPSKRRLDNPEDFVRIEIDMGLRHIDNVTPVIVQNASMPSEEELPRRLVQLGFQNAYFLRPEHFEEDLHGLVEDIARRHNIPQQPSPKPSLTRPIAGGIIGLLIIIAVFWGFMNLFNGGIAGEETPTTQVAQVVPTTGQNALGTVHAEQTDLYSTEQAFNNTATVERVQNATLTAQQKQFNTSETAAIKTLEFLSVTPSDTPVPPTATQTPTDTPASPAATNTPSDTPVPPTATNTPTRTPRPTNTPPPTRTPTPDPFDVAIERARAGVSNNAQWQAWYPNGFVQEFDDVEMVLVPAGCFVIGNENSQSDELNGNEVCLDMFWIDKYEVTNAQFGQFDIICTGSSSDLNRPYPCADWFEAQAHCESRGSRLPTEAEWEFAAGGEDELMYPWGNEFNPDNVVQSQLAGVSMLSVGSHPTGASWVGAMDMSGNAWEWTLSEYRNYPYIADDGRNDNLTENVLRVVRGGGFPFNRLSDLSTTNRLDRTASYGIDPFGFRCARGYDE